MSYLTLLPLHLIPRPRSHHKDTPNNRHRDVMSIFPVELQGRARADAGILFRLERLPARPAAYLIRSNIRPHITNPDLAQQVQILEEKFGWLEGGVIVNFRLSVNAVVREGATRKTRPVPVQTGPAGGMGIDEWVAQKLASALDNVTVLNHNREVITEKQGGKTIQVDVVDGIAEIADPALLESLMKKGVGRAKAYGCGLLTVKPAVP
ncbi:MAG: type I-E CRISPR-associated protein Cas6/Cse3/CasE [Actinomycetaceae bacterium]|nr:type I-E CRISPR-associated protein Cas6/Cse3/CasE [Actinomycetaceae bacterium]